VLGLEDVDAASFCRPRIPKVGVVAAISKPFPSGTVDVDVADLSLLQEPAETQSAHTHARSTRDPP